MSRAKLVTLPWDRSLLDSMPPGYPHGLLGWDRVDAYVLMWTRDEPRRVASALASLPPMRSFVDLRSEHDVSATHFTAVVRLVDAEWTLLTRGERMRRTTIEEGRLLSEKLKSGLQLLVFEDTSGAHLLDTYCPDGRRERLEWSDDVPFDVVGSAVAARGVSFPLVEIVAGEVRVVGVANDQIASAYLVYG